MPSKTPQSEIVNEVRRVLHSAAKGKGLSPNFLTAYQILSRLPMDLQTRLIEGHGRGGKGWGKGKGAANVVMRALRSLKAELEIAFLDTKGLELTVGDHVVEAGNRVCALYRIRPR
jgi:hypothetical protein